MTHPPNIHTTRAAAVNEMDQAQHHLTAALNATNDTDRSRAIHNATTHLQTATQLLTIIRNTIQWNEATTDTQRAGHMARIHTSRQTIKELTSTKMAFHNPPHTPT